MDNDKMKEARRNNIKRYWYKDMVGRRMEKLNEEIEMLETKDGYCTKCGGEINSLGDGLFHCRNCLVILHLEDLEDL